MKPIFSIPINPKLNSVQFDYFIKFLLDYKPWISDLYFTCRMPPFVQDAMGEIFISDELDPIEVALKIQEYTGIPISATFNNTIIRPSQHNLELFISNFKQLYDAGVKSATIPHTHWLATGQIQKAFPDLYIKNTILRNVTTPAEVAKLAEAGFHYVNLERDLMRDQDTLIRMKKVKEKYGIKLSLLANEGCVGGCAMMDEHFQFNNTRQGNGPQYFNDPISRVSCPKWDKEDPSVPLKTANFTPWREDWLELLEYVDVIKMHGRENVSRMFETMDIIRKFANEEDILFDTFNEYINETNLVNKPIDAWRKKIKNCKFDCWDCNFCDKVYETKSNQKNHPLILAVTKELVDSVNEPVNLDVMGLTSPRIQQLLFALSKHCTKYLEIGSALGATAAAVALNPNIEIHCVDNWSENIQPENGLFELPLNSRGLFEENVKHPKLTIHDQDMLLVDTSKISNVDLFFYDGPHDSKSVSSVLQHYKYSLSEYSILIFDDANWTDTVIGANDGVEKSGLIPIYSKMILNSQENPDQWWNGLYIMVVKNEGS